MNAPDRHESFLLGPGEPKITWVTDTRVPNAAIFTFHKEDHTLANPITDQLNRTPAVLFAGYKVPHPLVPNFELRCQTDGSVHPKDAVIRACGDLIQELARIDRDFTREFELKKIAAQGGAGAGGRTNGV